MDLIGTLAKSAPPSCAHSVRRPRTRPPEELIGQFGTGFYCRSWWPTRSNCLPAGESAANQSPAVRAPTPSSPSRMPCASVTLAPQAGRR